MKYEIGTKILVRGIQLTRIRLSSIKRESPSQLDYGRLHMLKTGFNQFAEIIDDPFWQGDPIKLERVGNYFTIIEGRHRVHLANELGFNAVWAII